MIGRRKYIFILLIFILSALLFSLNLITTNGVLKSVNFKNRSPVDLPLQQASSEIAEKTQSAVEHLKVPVIETLFRGDLPPKLNLDPPSLPIENKLNYQYMTNGHQNGGDGVESSKLGAVAQEQIQIDLKVPYKLVHIDLKGAPPKLTYLKSLFKLIKQNGANGILLEYEDMFPFTGSLNVTAHKFHFTKDEIQDLISTAIKNDLEVIPLIQTFGHLEFVLKLDKFRHLRELDDFPQEICPSNDRSFNLVTEIIDQVLSLKYSNERKNHLPSYIHIGCDEVYHIGECTKCREKSIKDLFLNHVTRVAKYIREKYGVTPIIWDDMMRKFYIEELVKSEIGSAVELMMWDYTEDVDHLLSPYLWPMYTQIFPNIWVSSAYKGAFGETLFKVNIQRHALNQLSWQRVLARESPRIRNLRGVALTGWSRYDHFAVLCELLPVSIPSLILSLQIWETGNFQSAITNLFKALKCDEVDLARIDMCQWDGADLSNLLSTLEYYQMQTSNLVQSQRFEKGWLTFYSVKHNYTSPWRVTEAFQQSSQILISLNGFESNVRSVLKKYFPPYVIDEWVEQKVESLKSRLKKLANDARGVAARKTWPRRPVV